MGKFCTRAELAAWEMALETFPERSPLSLRERLMELFPSEATLVLNGPESFMNIPVDFTFPDEKKADVAVPVKEKKEPQQIFCFVEIKTQYCVDDDLSFCEYLAKTYGRILENKNEKIFLRGNTFLAKLAKAVFEQNENLFAETCEKHKDEAYFRECAKTLERWNFAVDEGEEINKESWLSLYETVLLLTEEYLATKCELPKTSAFECKENSYETKTLEIIVAEQGSSEEDLKKAGLVPLKKGKLDNSSNEIAVGERFYEFLSENFPYKDNQNKLLEFMGNIYGKDACKNFNVKDVTKDSLPRPEFKVEAMEAVHLGSYKDKNVFINQRLVLDSICEEDTKVCFYLLLTMLLEYGRFLSDALREKAKLPSSSSNGNEGIDFAIGFMEHSNGKLLKEDFEYADFTALDAKGEDKKFVLGISGLSYEERLGIFNYVKFARN